MTDQPQTVDCVFMKACTGYGASCLDCDNNRNLRTNRFRAYRKVENLGFRKPTE